MDKFPENVELVDFFNGEPTLADPDKTIPWIYKSLKFTATLGEERVECLIDNPGLEVRWFRANAEVAILSFYAVKEISIQKYPDGKCLVAKEFGPKGNMTFRLQLKPRIHIAIDCSQ